MCVEVQNSRSPHANVHRTGEEDNNKNKTNPTPYLRRYFHVLVVRVLWENHLPSGENHSSVRDNTVERRKDKDDYL